MNADQRRLFHPLNFIRRFYIVVIALILFSPVAVLAETLAQYHEDVKVSNTLVGNLLYADNDEDASSDQLIRQQRDSLKRIRARLPATEKIEWQGGTIETDNRWLAEKLNKLEQLPEKDGERRNILTEITERLGAIEQKLDELENPATATTRTKDEDKQKLAEILRREEYQKPAEKEESLAQKIERQIAEWLAKIFPRADISPTVSGGFQSLSFVLQIILYALILGVIAFVVYRFAPFFVRRFQNRETKAKKERVILGERLAENETASNLFAEAEKLAREGNLRGAIRKGYIALLCDLSDRKIIRISQHKTNRDYLRDVRKQIEIYNNMSGLTVNYERHWYGFDEASAADWESFRDGYRQILNIEH